MVEQMAKSYQFPAKQLRLAESSCKRKMADNPRPPEQDQRPYIINPKYRHTLGFTHFQERLR